MSIGKATIGEDLLSGMLSNLQYGRAPGRLRYAAARYEYPEGVSRQGIRMIFGDDNGTPSCEPGGYRYRLYIPLNRSGCTVTVILKNPSGCDGEGCDRTTRNVLKYLLGADPFPQPVGLVVTVNLYAYQETDASALASLIRNYPAKQWEGTYNDQFIQAAAAQSDFVILAWGNPITGATREYRQRITSLWRQLDHRNVFCKGVTMRGFPRHLGGWRGQVADLQTVSAIDDRGTIKIV
jgi:hypothetical protein